ncbi:GNAT family N-acetyltransferase [Peribacillus muralis]|uniref:GNAT family N-acetyltransferase n=1 Tax=Peribacillus muralis TaxID=264697 RepID=UPI001F4E743D|nr:GNAT family N-acetyltransferase [Peribacillus muralis]MCK1995191.1 GNAT family N-acetyltransferase [Peribacillus muralis]MCK2015726.1 GNAT family N-acetyltransferase [Peribacillus muralis]
MKIRQTSNFECIATLNKYVHDLHSNLYPEHFKEYNYEKVKKYFKSLVNNESFLFLLLEDDGEALGYAWIELKEYPENAFKKGYKSVYVHQISIADTKRNKGYGSSLMEHIYEMANNRGIDVIELDYWCENSVAKNFYKKQDFIKYREFVYKKL